MNPLDTTYIVNNITSKYEPFSCRNSFGYKVEHLRNTETQEVFETSLKRLRKRLHKLLNGLTPENSPIQKKVGKHPYVYYIDKNSQVQIFKLGEKLGQGKYSEVYKGFAITQGKPCAYKTPVEQDSEQSAGKKTTDATKIIQEKKTQPAHHTSYSESENLTFLKETIERDDKKILKSLLPLHGDTPYLPFVMLLDKVEWVDKRDLILEFGGKTLSYYLHHGIAFGKKVDDVWQYATQLLSTLRLFEAMEVVHTDVKPLNIVLQKGKLKLIDFDVLIKLPPDDSEEYIKDKCITTRLYITKAVMDKIQGAKSNQEARNAWIYCQRVAFAHTISEILRLAPLKSKNEKNQKLKLVEEQKYTEIDITKMLHYDKFPDAIKQLITALLDENVPPINNFIDALNDDVKNAYEKNVFGLMQSLGNLY